MEAQPDASQRLLGAGATGQRVCALSQARIDRCVGGHSFAAAFSQMSAMEGRRRLWTPPSVLLLLLVLSAVVVALLSAPVSAKCLARLDTHPAEFDVCKRGTYCFLFLAEPPMVIVDGVDGAAAPPTDVDAPPGIRSPFPCADAGSKFGLTGASFDLHGSRGLWPSNTDLCVYAGSPSECTFSAMVAYLPNVKKPGHPAYGMALGTAGMLVQVVDRLPLAVPSIPIYEVRARLDVSIPPVLQRRPS